MGQKYHTEVYRYYDLNGIGQLHFMYFYTMGFESMEQYFVILLVHSFLFWSLIHPAGDGHLGCFKFLPMINKAAIALNE